MESLTLDEQHLLNDELVTGEALLWTGKPNRRVIFHASDWYMVPFSLLWGGFAIFWEAGVSGVGPWAGKGSPWSFGMLWGIPFVVIGQYMIWGRFFYTAWKKGRILYGLTTQRLIVLLRPPQAKVISRFLENVPGIEKEIRPDGIGTLKFGEIAPLYGRGRGKNANADSLYLNCSTPVFVDIDDAKETAELISRELRRTRQSASIHQSLS
jgi:hypothetical protein